MLNCREVVASATDYLNDDLPPLRRLRLRFHLLICRHCRRFLRQIQLTSATVARLTEAETSPADIEQQARRLRQYQQHALPGEPPEPLD